MMQINQNECTLAGRVFGIALNESSNEFGDHPGYLNNFAFYVINDATGTKYNIFARDDVKLDDIAKWTSLALTSFIEHKIIEVRCKPFDNVEDTGNYYINSAKI